MYQFCPKETAMKCTVIIPVYNKEAYVEKCLMCALSQDFDDYEVIAVDDGATDASGRICDEVACKQQRLRVIHTQNGGVTAARRRGLEESKGEYVMFCDADDELLPHALRLSYEAMMTSGADEVIAPYQNQRGDIFDTGNRGFIEPETIIADYLATYNSFPSHCGILFRRELLQGCLDMPRYLICGEDILLHIRCLCKRPKVYCIAQSNYVYNQGIPNDRHVTLQHEMLYDKVLFDSLQPLWSQMEYWYRRRQVKTYEVFLDKRQFHVRREYYQKELKGRLNRRFPLADRIAFLLPPRLAYWPVHLYKAWLRRKSRQIFSS